MAFDPSAIMDELAAQLEKSGWVTGQIAEPMAAPPQRMGAVIFGGVDMTEASLQSGSGIVKLIIRFYFNALEEPQAKMEKDLAKACLRAISDISGKYRLGDDSVRNVVPLALAVRPAFQTVSGTMYRLADLSVQVLVNDIGTWAA